MESGENMKVCGDWASLWGYLRAYCYRCAVDYILFFTGDVDVTANENEIRDWKYVDKAELQAMFEAPGTKLPIFGLPMGK